MIDLLMVGKFLLHKLFESLKHLYLHSNQLMHQYRMIALLMVGKFPLHRLFDWIFLYENAILWQ
mgnify:CR=1 FL=1